jgi:flagellar biosynthesis protein FliR
VIYAARRAVALMPQLQIFFLAMPINISRLRALMLFIGVMMTAFLDFFAEQMRLSGL